MIKTVDNAQKSAKITLNVVFAVMRKAGTFDLVFHRILEIKNGVHFYAALFFARTGLPATHFVVLARTTNKDSFVSVHLHSSFIIDEYMEDKFSLLQTLYEIVKDDPHLLLYHCTIREILLRQQGDWQEMHLQELVLDQYIQLKTSPAPLLLLTEKGLLFARNKTSSPVTPES